MNEDQVKGLGEKVKGKISEGVGKVTNDPAQEANGAAQQIAGEVRTGSRRGQARYERCRGGYD